MLSHNEAGWLVEMVTQDPDNSENWLEVTGNRHSYAQTFPTILTSHERPARNQFSDFVRDTLVDWYQRSRYLLSKLEV
jgi:hypothetical protein